MILMSLRGGLRRSSVEIPTKQSLHLNQVVFLLKSRVPAKEWPAMAWNSEKK